jgi:hypothetical protein
VAAQQVGGEGGAMLGQSSEEAMGRMATLVVGRATGDGAVCELRAGCDALGKEEGYEVERPILFF